MNLEEEAVAAGARTRARELLLAPVPMVLLNATLLGFVWYAAIHTARQRAAS